MNPDPEPAARAGTTRPVGKKFRFIKSPFAGAVAQAAKAGRVRPAHSMGRMVHGSRFRTATTHSLLPLWLMIGGVSVVALLLVLAIPDLRKSLRAPVLAPPIPAAEDVLVSLRELDIHRVVAPSGAFSVSAPAGWEQVTGPDAKPYDLTFQNPRGVMISLMATPVKYDDLRSLTADIRRREKDSQLVTTMDIVRVGDRQVIQRNVRLSRQRILAHDFVENRVAYHALCCAPTKLYETYEPLFLEVLKSLTADAAVKPAAAPPESGAAGTPGSG
jgi:hypothetical protein